MRLIAFAIALATLIPAATAGDLMVVKPSKYSVAKTIDRLSAVLKRKGITIFARVDHAAGARKVGLEMAPTELLIFGNPKMGTPLMLSNRQMAIDLPMKALAWRDEAGKVWLGYIRPEVLKTRHAISDRDAVFAKMAGALAKLTDAAAGGS